MGNSSGMNHPKLEKIKIDFDMPESWKYVVQGDVLLSTLGTKSSEAQSRMVEGLEIFSQPKQFSFV
jgi:hypothetical protein